MSKQKPWEDFEHYQLTLKLRQVEQEKRLSDNWNSLRHSWKENGAWIREQVEAFSSGKTENLIWGPVGRLLIDLVRSKLFHSKKN